MARHRVITESKCFIVKDISNVRERFTESNFHLQNSVMVGRQLGSIINITDQTSESVQKMFREKDEHSRMWSPLADNDNEKVRTAAHRGKRKRNEITTM